MVVVWVRSQKDNWIIQWGFLRVVNFIPKTTVLLSKFIVCDIKYTCASLSTSSLRDHSCITSAKGLGWLVWKRVNFADGSVLHLWWPLDAIGSSQIQKELTKLIKNPKRFCDVSNTTNVQGLRSFQNWGSQKCLQKNLDQKFKLDSKK